MRGQERGKGGGSFGRRGGRSSGRAGGRGRSLQGWESEEMGVRAIQDALVTATTMASQEKTQRAMTIARRPDPGGTAGKQIVLLANHFIVQCLATTAYHYSVDINLADPKLPADQSAEASAGVQPLLPQKLCRNVMDQCAQQNSWETTWVYDGKRHLFAPREILSRGLQTWKVALKDACGQSTQFEVSTRIGSVIDLLKIANYCHQGDIEIPRDALQPLETALRFAALKNPSCYAAGRGIFFDTPDRNRPLPGGTEVWLGYHQALKPCQLGLTLNLDSAAMAFLQQKNLVDVMVSVAGVRRPEDLRRGVDKSQWKKINDFVSGVQITTIHREGKNPKRRVKWITEKSAENTSFSLKGGGETTVAKHWEKMYGGLQYPWLPCLDVSRGQSLSYFPPEVCKILPGQLCKELTDEQETQMTSARGQDPAKRSQDIREAVQYVTSKAIGSAGNVFGLNISNDMARVVSRVLPPPFLECGVPKAMNPGTRGSWRLDRIQLLAAGTIESWVMANFCEVSSIMVPGERGIDEFLNSLARVLQGFGLRVPDQLPPLVHCQPTTESPLKVLERAVQLAEETFGCAPGIILVLLPSKDAQLYREIKSASDCSIGVPTQCLHAPQAGVGRVSRSRVAYLEHVSLKINVKVGGSNWKISAPVSTAFPVVGHQPFVVFGADVTHPTGYDRKEPSVAAVVGSLDGMVTRFAARIIVQPHRQELIALKDAVKDLLIAFRNATRYKPEAILFYRDGIGEGQLKKCLENECKDIRKACIELEEDYTPAITFVIVNKRHRTRFFPVSPEQGDRNGNTLCGTVVDKGVCSPAGFDFFLNSHCGVQGTNRPVHYSVLLDENRFGSDGIQIMTYWLCYLYCRCSRPMSTVPPVFYAHLAALRGKILLDKFESESAEGERANLVRINEKLRDMMYFI